MYINIFLQIKVIFRKIYFVFAPENALYLAVFCENSDLLAVSTDIHSLKTTELQNHCRTIDTHIQDGATGAYVGQLVPLRYKPLLCY
jgi:hypothetical protein